MQVNENKHVNNYMHDVKVEGHVHVNKHFGKTFSKFNIMQLYYNTTGMYIRILLEYKFLTCALTFSVQMKTNTSNQIAQIQKWMPSLTFLIQNSLSSVLYFITVILSSNPATR